MRRIYGVLEKQFRKYFKEAVRRKGDTSENLISILECRLDAIIYRMKFVPTVFAARQFVNHGHILVNGKKVTSPSYLVKITEEFTFFAPEAFTPDYDSKNETFKVFGNGRCI